MERILLPSARRIADGYGPMSSTRTENSLADPRPTGADSASPIAAPAPPSAFSSGTLQLLKGGPFSRYAAGEAISMTGTWMQAMAQGWVMTGLTGSAFWLGMVNLCASVPMLALTMIGGSVADRYDKRKILLTAQVVQIILAVAIGYLVLINQVQIWHILVASTLLGVSNSFEMPAASALVPELVNKEQISGAIAIDRAIFHGTRLIGPSIAGIVLVKLGTASGFFANALSFLALMLALLTLRPRAAGTAEEEEERSSGMRAGIDYVRGDRPTVAMLGLMGAASLCVFPFMAVMMPLYARNELHLGADKAGLLMGVSGVGSLVASVGMLSVPRTRRMPVMIAGAVVVAGSLLALSQAHFFWTAASSLATLAVGTSLIYGLANTTVQERAPGPLRGRVSALAAMSFVVMMPFSSIGMGELADHLGMRVTMMVAAGLYALAGFFIFTGPGKRCSELPPAVTVGAA